jgi:heavy metal translocating P-type ATPase
MIFELAALSSVLYVGFKKFEKYREIDKNIGIKGKDIQSLSKQNPQTTKTAMAEKLTQMIDDSDQNQENGLTRQKKSKQNSFKTQNTRALVSSSIGLTFSTFGLFSPLLGFFSIPFLIYSTKNNLKKTYQLMKNGRVSVETLISITVFGCVFLGRFFIASLMSLLITLATKLTAYVTHNSRQQLMDAFAQHPNFVWVMVDGVEMRVNFEDLQEGDVVVVHTGEMIPADGHVVEGMGSIDQHVLTGEARPVDKGAGEEVFASTVVLSGKILMKVEKAGQETTVAKITTILNKTVDFKSTTQLRAEILSQELVVPALMAGGLALPILGFNGALAVINSHFKNKIMIIAPISILNHLNLASKQGILIKDGRSLELMSKVDTIVFDKTGTLTEEQPHVGNIHCFSPYYSKDEVLKYATAAEYKQNHPLAKAIIEEAEKRQLEIPAIDESEYKLGYGLMVMVSGKTIHVGSIRFMEVENLEFPLELKYQQDLAHEQGYTLVLVAINRQIVGAIELLPTIRPEAKEMIRRLKQRNNIKDTYIISGDHEVPTRKLAQEVGIDHYFAETLPENKANLIEQLQEEGRFICYIGDGINDSIALKKAQVSISLSGASTVATDTAQIILMDSGLSHLEFLFDLADKFKNNMDTTFTLMITPAIIGVSGAFLLGLGIGFTVLLNIVGLILGVSNAAVMPLLESPTKQPLLSSAPPEIGEHHEKAQIN